ncbi:hypothetical protein BDF20DRAFT_840214 [Mycotypha africana]|uniref:uncharacterized protein n=1 Tax=Mycotypha africana TaxID=64632 RepID=UPI0023002ECA|nr:uncharacterized protein BDF20DRAFT_840214 [Mycotypha africana]KAI8967360.1 hypothetical protein BDF20DRAFT_840214 [Mycotypha africana]
MTYPTNWYVHNSSFDKLLNHIFVLSTSITLFLNCHAILFHRGCCTITESIFASKNQCYYRHYGSPSLGKNQVLNLLIREEGNLQIYILHIKRIKILMIFLVQTVDEMN